MDLIAKASEGAAKALKIDYGFLSGDMVATNAFIYVLFISCNLIELNY